MATNRSKVYERLDGGKLVVCHSSGNESEYCRVYYADEIPDISVCIECRKESGIHADKKGEGFVWIRKPHAFIEEHGKAMKPLCPTCANALKALSLLGQ